MRWWMRSSKSRRRASRRRSEHHAQKRSPRYAARFFRRSPAPIWPRLDPHLSLHTLADARLALPASADMLAIWRRGDRAFRFVGGRMDDTRAFDALPSARHVGFGFRAARISRKFALVFSVALRAVARRERPSKRSSERTRRGLILVHHPRRAGRFQRL